jgi:hypothetical protein
VLGPEEKMDIECWFKPQKSERELQGFKSTQTVDTKVESFSLNFRVTSSAGGVEGNQLYLQVVGRAMEPSVKFEHHELNFGETPVNTELMMETMLTNRSNFLSLPFKFNKCPQFRIRPMQGVLKPLEARRVKVMFKPGNMGKFKAVMKCTLGDGLKVLSIPLSGKSEFSAPSMGLTGGTTLVPSDFKRNATLVNPSSPNKFPKMTFTRTEFDYKNHLKGMKTGMMPGYAGYGDKVTNRFPLGDMADSNTMLKTF